MHQQPQLTPEQFAKLEPEKVLRIMQVIAAALMMGVIIFGLIVIMQLNGNQPNPVQKPNLLKGNPPMMAYIGIIGALIMIVCRFVIPPLVSRTLISQIQREASPDTPEILGRMLMAAQTRMILEYALLEGAAFLNLVALMIDHSPISGGVVIVLLALMMLNFPTMNKLVNWMERQQENLIAD